MGECPKVLIRLARASQLASSEGVRIGFALSIWQEAAGCDLNLHLRSSLKGRERIMNSIAQSGTAGEELTLRAYPSGRSHRACASQGRGTGAYHSSFPPGRARLRGSTQGYGEDAAFISAGGYHHHIGLNTWESKGGLPPALWNHRGLFHPGNPLPDTGGLTCRCPASPDRRGHSARWRERPWRQRGALSARSRRERRRALLGSPRGGYGRAPPQGELQMYTHRLDLEGLLRAAGSRSSPV